MDKKKWLVSILICTYNAAQTIEKTLLSCLNQSYRNVEVLIHDDQSKDDTLTIIRMLMDPRVRIIETGKKLWPYAGLNALLDEAQWEYIAIQDHDDLRHPQKLEFQIKLLSEHEKYIGCGTKTLMWYEGDKKWFEYYLGSENYYTIHPSLVFRNTTIRYPINTDYMVDAYFQKQLCNGKKIIANIDQTLTLHLVKAGAKNYSYKRFTYSFATLRSIFFLHPVWYGICILGRETLRKIVYPLLHLSGKGYFIDRLERLPFVLLGNKIGDYDLDKLKALGF